MLVGLGLMTAFVSTATLTTLSVMLIRKTHAQELTYLAESLGNAAAATLSDPVELERRVKDFSGAPGLKLGCIYNKDNLLLAQWRAKNVTTPCPGVPSGAGIGQSHSLASISHPIHKNGVYYGMVYLESSLGPFSRTMQRALLISFISMFLAGVACLAGARLKARHASRPIVALADYVRRLGSNGNARAVSFCDTAETRDMRSDIALLRAADIADKVTIGEMEKKRRWYRGTMFGLLAWLRRRVDDESSLVPTINDYNLLLKVDEDETPPKPRRYDLMTLTDRALATAKKIHPVDPEVHLMLSVKPGTPRYWLGQEEMIESLLRNLLLIALRRTQLGIICLRLETSTVEEGIPALLHFTLEDNGEALTAEELGRLMTEHGATTAECVKPFDLSWIILARLLPLLGGRLRMRTYRPPVFTGDFPAGSPDAIAVPLPPRGTAPVHKQETLPLVLLVEDDRTNREAERLMFNKAGCRVLAVATAEQAMQWATAMPFSVIAIDTALPGMQGPEFAVQLKRMLQSGPMPMPKLWALTSANTSRDREAWEKAGAEIVLVKPVGMPQILPLCATLSFCDTCSFLAHSDDIEGGLSQAIGKRLPALRRELAHQIGLLIDTFAGQRPDQSVADAAHAVKSASLSLGYQRLSACMDALEHMTRSEGRQAIGKDNFLYLEEMLDGVIKILNPSVSLLLQEPPLLAQHPPSPPP